MMRPLTWLERTKIASVLLLQRAFGYRRCQRRQRRGLSNDRRFHSNRCAHRLSSEKRVRLDTIGCSGIVVHIIYSLQYLTARAERPTRYGNRLKEDSKMLEVIWIFHARISGRCYCGLALGVKNCYNSVRIKFFTCMFWEWINIEYFRDKVAF